MTVGGRADLAAVTLADLVAEAASWSLGAAAASEAAVSTLEQLRAALDIVDVPDDLAALVRQRCRTFLG